MCTTYMHIYIYIYNNNNIYIYIYIYLYICHIHIYMLRPPPPCPQNLLFDKLAWYLADREDVFKTEWIAFRHRRHVQEVAGWLQTQKMLSRDCT